MDAGSRPDRLRAAEATALVALALLGLAAWLRYPVEPTYDSLASLLWGRDIIEGRIPQFASFHAPTEHPLWLAVSTALAPLGDGAGRAMTFLTVASLVALIAGTYRLGRTVFGPVAGAIAAVLLLTRLNFGFYAAFGFVDVPFVAAVAWAAALEAERPRRGGIVWVLLIASGLLRPEGWVIAAAYAVWLGWSLPRPARVRLAVLVATAPGLWALTDLIVTGDPTFSFTYTTDAASELGRTRGVLHLPESVYGALREVLKLPVLLAGVGGVLLASRPRGHAARVLMAVAALGLITFSGLVLAGVSAQVPRYAAVMAVALTVYAGNLVVQAGAFVLHRRSWVLTPAVVVLLGVGLVLTATRLHPESAADELRFRHTVEQDLVAALETRAVREARRCGPVAVPTHKLLPVTRWHVGGPEQNVVARSDVHANHRPGVVLIMQGYRLLHSAAYGPYTAGTGAPARITQGVPYQLRFRGRSPGRYFAVYTRC